MKSDDLQVRYTFLLVVLAKHNNGRIDYNRQIQITIYIYCIL